MRGREEGSEEERSSTHDVLVLLVPPPPLNRCRNDSSNSAPFVEYITNIPFPWPPSLLSRNSKALSSWAAAEKRSWQFRRGKKQMIFFCLACRKFNPSKFKTVQKFYIYQVYDQHGVEKTATPRQRKSFPVFQWDGQMAGHPEMSRLPFLVLIASRGSYTTLTASRTTRKTDHAGCWLEIEKWHPSNSARNVVNNEGQVLSAVVGCSSVPSGNWTLSAILVCMSSLHVDRC